jgi:hypothetical protein
MIANRMERSLSVVVAWFVVVIVGVGQAGCDKKDELATDAKTPAHPTPLPFPNTSPSVVPASATFSPLAAEAIKASEAEREKHWFIAPAPDLLRADWRHTYEPSFSGPQVSVYTTESIRASFQAKLRESYIEGRSIKYRLVEGNLSESDRLNGIQWKGALVYQASSIRIHNAGRDWSHWMPEHHFATYGRSVVKKNGQWEVDEPPFGIFNGNDETASSSIPVQ